MLNLFLINSISVKLVEELVGGLSGGGTTSSGDGGSK